MVYGTRAKQMENWLDVIEVGLRQHPEQVDDRLETMELGIRNTQEEIHRSRSEYKATLDCAVNGIQEEFAVQKVEIEKLIREMLSKNLVQPSQSPYALLVLLVKKKDGTWKFCVDYR